MSVRPNMSARDIGKAVRKPINIVRFLGCSAMVDARALGVCLHGAKNILAWTRDLFRDVDGAIDAAVSVSFTALSKSASTGWSSWLTEHCQFRSSTLCHHSSHSSQDLTW